MRKRLDAMEEECDRASRIIRDLLVFARRKPPERRRTDVSEVIRATLALQAPQFELSKIRVGSDLAASPAILADAHQLQQVLLNLFNNATHAMQTHAGARRAQRALDRQGGEVVVQVEDDGPGIPSEHLGRIFDPFFTTKGAGEGTGLGLSLSIGIIEAHGGRMAAENLPGRGRPLHPAPARRRCGETAAAGTAAPRAHGGDRRPRRPACSSSTTRSACDASSPMSSRRSATTSRRRRRRAGDQKLGAGDYDVVMLDLRLPDVDGRAVWQWLGERGRRSCTRGVHDRRHDERRDPAVPRRAAGGPW